MIVVLLFSLAITLWTIRQPAFAVLLVFVGAGLPALLLPLPGHTMRPVEPALMLCLFIVLTRRTQMRLRLPHLLALLFFALALVSFLHVPQIATALNAYGADKRLYDLFLLLLALFCGTWLATYINDSSTFLVNVLFVNIPVYLVAVAQMIGLPLSSLLENSSAQDPKQTLGRLWGPFDGAVTFGLYLTNLFAVSLSCWLLGTSRRYRWFGAIMTIAAVFGIIGSGTRSAILAAGLMLLVALLLTRHFAWLLGLIPLVVAVLLVSPAAIIARFTHDATSTDNRLFLWQVAIKLITAHPWIGIGLQQFPTYYAQLIVSQSAALNPEGISVHNQYLELAMESGIFWFLIGVWLLCSIVYSCWRAYRIAQRRQQILLLASILACVATLLTSFFDVPLDKTEASVFLFLLAGLALGMAEHIRWGNIALPYIGWGNVGTDVSHPFVNAIELPSTRGRDTSVPTLEEESHAVPNVRKTGRSIFVQLLSWGVAVPIIFPTTALLARYLGPIRYGEYSTTLPFLAVFALLTGTGMDPLLIRRLSRQSRLLWGETLSNAVGVRLLSTLCSIACAAGVALLLPIGAELRTLLLLGCFSLLFSYSFNGLRTIYEHGFRAEEHVMPVSLLEVINRIVTALLIVLSIVLHLPFLWIYALIIYSDLPFCLILMILARRRFGVRLKLSRIRLSHFRTYLLESIPLSGYNVMTLISGQADLLLLALFADARSVGMYALASRITDPLIALVLAYAGGLYPLFCKKYAEGHKAFAQVYYEATRILAMAIVPLALLVTVEAPVLVALLGGSQFGAATTIVQLLMWAMVVTFLNQLAVRACTSVDKERQIPYVTLASMLLNLLLNILLIPQWQGVGAAFAALLSECVGLGLFMFLLRESIDTRKTLGVILLVLLSNLPALVFLLWQQHSSLLLTLPLALLLTLGAYLIMGTLSIRDLTAILALLLRQRKETQRASPSSHAWLPTPDITEQATIILPRIQL